MTVTSLVRSTVVVLLLAAATLAAPGSAQAGVAACRGERTTGSGDTVDLASSCFAPSVLHVEPGATVTWTNSDPVTHAVTGVGLSFGTYDQVGTGETVSARFDVPGVYPYFCLLHPTMVGAVVVGDPQAVAQTVEAGVDAGADGAGGPVVPALLLGLSGLVVGAAGVSVAPRLVRRR